MESNESKAKRIQSAAPSRYVRRIVLNESSNLENDVFATAIKRAKSISGPNRDKLVRIGGEVVEAKGEGRDEVVELEEETFVARKEETKLRKNSVGDLLNKRLNLEAALRERELKDSTVSDDNTNIVNSKRKNQTTEDEGKENSDKSNGNAQPKNGCDEKEVKKCENEKKDKAAEENKDEFFHAKKEEKCSRKNSISEILSRRSSIGIMSPRNTIIPKRIDPDEIQIDDTTKNQKDLGTQLHYHTSSGNLVMIKEMLSNNPDLLNYRADDGRTILHIASSHGHLEIVKELLMTRKMDINLTMYNGLTALMLSAAQGKFDVLQYLLQSGASYALQTINDGYSALHLSCMHHQLQSLRSLLTFVNENMSNQPSKKSNNSKSSSSAVQEYLELRSHKGYSALHLATVECDLDMIELLVQFGADYKASTNKKWTPLHFAAHVGNLGICNYLLKLDPSLVDAKNDAKEKPFDIAVFQKNEKLLEVLTPKIHKSKRRSRKEKKSKESQTSLNSNNSNNNNIIDQKESVQIENDLVEKIKVNPSLLKEIKENSKNLLSLMGNEQEYIVKEVNENPKCIEEFLAIGKDVLLHMIDNQPHLLLATVQSPISMLRKVKTPAKLFKLLKQIEENPMKFMKEDCKEDPELFFLQQLRDNQFLRYQFVLRLRENRTVLLPFIKVFSRVSAEDATEPEEEKNMKTKMTNRLMKSTVSKHLKRLIDSKDVNNDEQ